MKRRHESTFVAPAPTPKRIEIVEGERDLPAPPSPVLLPKAGYRDRAAGFTIATMPLAVVVGAVAALIGVIGWAVPVASLITLLLALGGFAAVWLVAYLAHVLVSPDGALFVHVWLTWRWLRSEQKERHKRLEKMIDERD